MVESRLRKYVSKQKWSKYFWVTNYHNWFCTRYEYFIDSHKIDLSKIPDVPGELNEVGHIFLSKEERGSQ